ncbi:phenolic acid decarboxylase [Enterobacter asburiae]|nr:phenolic acid decarboxylase [Enterobacter asburiae]
MHAVQFAPGIYKVEWHEPTGTCISLLFDLHRKVIHSPLFIPQRIAGEGLHFGPPLCYQNDKHLIALWMVKRNTLTKKRLDK